MSNPRWWTEEHTSAWDRVKHAMKRDWEQTKSDLSLGKKGTDLDQGVGDTVKQAAGKEAIPPVTAKNPPDAAAWKDVEDEYRFGAGARRQYGDKWDTGVESSLARDWGELNARKSWDQAKPRVRRAWEIDPEDNKRR